MEGGGEGRGERVNTKYMQERENLWKKIDLSTVR